MLNDFVMEIINSKVTLIPWKDIYMTFLLGIDEDLDDDLLQDAIELMVDL